MPINETLSATASVSVNNRTLSKSSNTVTIVDTSNDVVTINITNSWLTTAARSIYGSRWHLKPTVNAYAEITRRGVFDPTKKYLFVIEDDVAVIADNINVGGFHVDNRIPAGTKIELEVRGLLLGRGGMCADFNRDDYASRINLNGQNGGPAITSTIPLTVRVSGGLAGGGGGGGNQGYYWNDDWWFATNIYEYWYVGPKYPVSSGSGAPFGLRTDGGESSGPMEELAHVNRDIMYEWDNAPANVIRLGSENNNRQVMDALRWKLNIKPLELTGRIMADDTEVAYNPPIPLVATRYFAGPNAYPYTDFQHNYYRPRDQRYGYIPTVYVITGIKYMPVTNGGKVETTGHAGLFRGAMPGILFRHHIDGSSWCAPLMGQTQAYIDARADRLRGAFGGDVGGVGGNGSMPMSITGRRGGTVFAGGPSYESMDGIHGLCRASGYTTKNNIDTVIPVGPSNGGRAGPNANRADIVITAVDNGAIGGAQVLAKFDPNGDYDLRANGNIRWFGNGLKGRWYTI